MVTRRLVFVTSIVATAISSFTLGVLHTRRTETAARGGYDAQIEALRAEMRSQLGHAQQKSEAVLPAGTVGQVAAKDTPEPGPSMTARAKMVAEIKQQLQSEMGLLPVHLLRDRRSSFVELYS